MGARREERGSRMREKGGGERREVERGHREEARWSGGVEDGGAMEAGAEAARRCGDRGGAWIGAGWRKSTHGEEKKKRRGREREKKRKGEGLKRKGRDPIVRWRDQNRKRKKRRRVAAKRQGVGKEVSRGKTLGFGG